MIISYNWISEYLPTKIDPEKLSRILTSIGLEVESLTAFETIRGGLAGLITAEIVTCEKHQDADKLKVTTVNTGSETIQVVCGAPNAAAGQKVIFAKAGTTIYPVSGEPLTLKKVKIRGVESNGMICAEDEIGIGPSHDGILVLPVTTKIGVPAATLFETYSDFIFEIGLTPNRMDAMSHIGVAKDVCAWLSHHEKKGSTPTLPYKNRFQPGSAVAPVKVVIENTVDCQRYSGLYISGLTVTDSPKWLQQKLQAIGVKSISNIVDITNFILHESGQPLHAFDADKISGNVIRVGNMPEGTVFKTLDDKERKLTAEDLMICNESEGMCIAGVYGGIGSGVTEVTANIFLESAWFHPQSIRKTSVRHGLRTDAATRFEKGVDISNTVTVLKRAAELIVEICGGKIVGDVIDVYPQPAAPVSVGLKYHYLKKLSGKNYHGDTIKNILSALGFEIQREGMDELWVKVPTSKPDITLPADIVEEIMRIDGLDNIDIPATISIAPSGIDRADNSGLQEKLANQLTGLGFSEIFTNSITNSQYYDEEALTPAVRMMNNLSIELDIMRPTMLPTGLEVVAHNINRKNANLLFFENGKTYATVAEGKYEEQKHLSLFATGNVRHASWNQAEANAEYYFVKAICEKVLASCGIVGAAFQATQDKSLEQAATISFRGQAIGTLGAVSERVLKQFGIRQPVIYADLSWQALLEVRKAAAFVYAEVGKFPAVHRDLAFVVNKTVTYAELQTTVAALNVPQLQGMRLFDVFESEKLGSDKKSLAVSFTFMDNSKTLVDTEVDAIMNRIISTCETTLHAEIRK